MTSSATLRGSGQATGRTVNYLFPVIVAEVELTALAQHINASRWPEREMVTGQSQCALLATMRELV